METGTHFEIVGKERADRYRCQLEVSLEGRRAEGAFRGRSCPARFWFGVRTFEENEHHDGAKKRAEDRHAELLQHILHNIFADHRDHQLDSELVEADGRLARLQSHLQ